MILLVGILSLVGIWLLFTFPKLTTVAFLMALSWVFYYKYNYRNKDQIIIGDINLMPLFAWTVGLVIARLFYEWCLNSMTNRNCLMLLGIFWILSVCTIEWIGYNILEIKLKSNYTGLLGFKLMHGPWYLKAFYLCVWMIYFGILDILLPHCRIWEIIGISTV